MGFRLFASTTNAMSSIIDRVNFFPSLLSSPPNGSRLLKPVTVFGGKTESRARYIYIYILLDVVQSLLPLKQFTNYREMERLEKER